jgi:hypothetical protein
MEGNHLDKKEKKRLSQAYSLNMMTIEDFTLLRKGPY